MNGTDADTAPTTTAADDPNPFITPPTKLLTKVINPQTSQVDYAFPLQTAAWLKMQNVVRAALAFPLTSADFTSSYGSFADEGTVTQAVQVLGQVNTTAARYGDPTTMISQFDAFQQADTAPDTIYANAIWLSAQTVNAAQQIVSLLQIGKTAIGQELDAAQRIEDLTGLLQGDGGVSSQATTLSKQFAAFHDKTAAFYDTLNTELTGSAPSVKAYLDQSSNVLLDAQNVVTQDAASIEQMNLTIRELNKQYVGFTTAASVSPLFILVPFVGPVLAVADATTFGVLASKVKSQMDSLNNQVAAMTTDEQQKSALVAQLTSFKLAMDDVYIDGEGFLNSIGQLQAGWAEFESQIGARLENLTVDDVKDWSAFLDKIQFQTAIDGWNRIATQAEQFYQTGFVTFTSAPSAN